MFSLWPLLLLLFWLKPPPISVIFRFFFCGYLWRHSLTDEKRKQRLFLSPQRWLLDDVTVASCTALCCCSGSVSIVSTPLLPDVCGMCCICCLMNSGTEVSSEDSCSVAILEYCCTKVFIIILTATKKKQLSIADMFIEFLRNSFWHFIYLFLFICFSIYMKITKLWFHVCPQKNIFAMLKFLLCQGSHIRNVTYVWWSSHYVKTFCFLSDLIVVRLIITLWRYGFRQFTPTNMLKLSFFCMFFRCWDFQWKSCHSQNSWRGCGVFVRLTNSRCDWSNVEIWGNKYCRQICGCS